MLGITNLPKIRYPSMWLTLITTTLALFVQTAPLSSKQLFAASEQQWIITGELLDSQNQPIEYALITLTNPESQTELGETETQANGSWQLHLDNEPTGSEIISINRNHFFAQSFPLTPETINQLQLNQSAYLGTITLERQITLGFWAATLIFVAVLGLIALEKLHSTSAALLGLSLVFGITFSSYLLNIPSLYILNFEQGLRYINWEVIFLIMAMMIIIAIIEDTGVFQWMAFQAYRISRGKGWVLVIILMIVTATASALLDNFTTMLLMTPISLQIGAALEMNPLALIIPEVLASNVGGISTLIGTPTNILIGAYADIGFSDFLTHQTIGVLIALIFTISYSIWHFRADLLGIQETISPNLYARLEKNAQIENPTALWKSSIVFLIVLAGFVFGEQYHIPPAVPALMGATTLIIWLKPDVDQMINAVDWTTLVFFMALFLVVGAIQEVGFISLIADKMGVLIGDNLFLATFVVVFGTGLISIFIANIPLTASLLPVVDYLSLTIPGAAESKILFYALSMGAALGGNGSLIAAEANLVTAGITTQAGTPISFKAFFKIGFPVTLITLLTGFLWLAFHFSIF